MSVTASAHVAAPSVPMGPATSAARLAALAVHPHPFVRARVASHPGTDLDTLLLLATDRDRGVSSKAATRLH